MTKPLMEIKALCLAVLFFFLILAPLTIGQAQDYVTGSFEGEVKDSVTGNPITGATVRITNQETGVPVAKQTDSAGRFRQNLLPPGEYTITILKPGYLPQSTERSLSTMRPTVVLPPVPLVPESTAIATESPKPETPVATATPAPSSQGPASQPAESKSIPSSAGIQEQINTNDAQRGGTYTEKEVSTLPLGGMTITRTFDELGLLLPGVAPPPETLGVVAGPGVGPGVGSAGQFSVNGMRSRANNFTVDGSDNNDEDIGVRRQGFFALVPQPIESIREFQMITLLAPAQYGRNMGAQVNAISKSGGNETHGTLFGFLNASQLNARNPLDTNNGNARSLLTVGPRPVLDCTNVPFSQFCTRANGRDIFTTNQSGGKDSMTLTQGGVVIGGPLIPDHLFYFFTAEGHFLNARREGNFAVPTVEERGLFGTGATGISANPFTGIPVLAFPTTIDADSIFSLFPFPNNPGGIYGANTFTQNLAASGQGKVFSGKADYNFKINQRQQQFTARYNFTDDWRDVAVTGGALFSSLRPRVRTQNFSTFLNSELSGSNSTRPLFNQLRLSYGRTRLIFDENRDTEFLIPSALFPNEPFLLNARRLVNLTLPIDPATRYALGGTVEGDLGPIGQLSIAGFSPVGVDVFNFPQRRVNNTYQLADTMTYRVGSHSFAFGTDIRRTELNSDLPRNSRPLLTFNGAPLGTGFISGVDLAAASAPTGFFQTLTTGGTDIGLRYYQLDFFGQDEWRIHSNLSLSYGLRYEYNTPPREVNERIEGALASPALSLLPGLAAFQNRNRIYEPDRNNFAPRLGLAYSPNWFGSDRATVVRAGYGLFYDQILGAVVSQSRNVFPNALTVNFAGGRGGATNAAFDVFNPATTTINIGTATNPNFVPLTNGLGGFNTQVPLSTFVNIVNDVFPSGFGATLPARHLETPFAHQFSATLEQQISRNLVGSVAYVGTLGRSLLRTTTPNLGPNAILLPTFFNVEDNVPTFGGFVLPPNGERPIPTAGAVTIYDSSARSRYDALQLQLRGRYDFLGATQFQVNYTYGKVTDDVSDVFDLAGASALPQNSLTFAGEYGPANFDARHRVASNYISDLSSWGRKNDFLHLIFNGLEVAGTGVFQTGQPFTVNSVNDVNLDGNLTDRLNSTAGIVLTGDRAQPLRLTVPATSLLAPIGQDGAVPRNSFRSSNLWITNAAVVKTFRFSEDTKLIFRAEAFNLFNRANFGIPVRFLESPGFGRSTDTITPGRRIQFGLKLAF